MGWDILLQMISHGAEWIGNGAIQCLIGFSSCLAAIVFWDWFQIKCRYHRLKGGYFVGARWQEDLFDSIVNKSLTEDMLSDILTYNETKNWIEEDLLEHYSPSIIYRFNTSRYEIIKNYYSKDGYHVIFEDEYYENVSKTLEKIIDEIDKALGDISQKIKHLQSTISSRDNIEMATAKAKKQQLKDLSKMQHALTAIRGSVEKLLNRVIKYERSKSERILRRELHRELHRGLIKSIRIFVYELKSKFNSEIIYDNNNIYGRIIYRLYRVDYRIEYLKNVKVKRKIYYLNDKISDYKGLGDVDSTAYAKNVLDKKKMELANIIHDLESIEVLVANGTKIAKGLRDKYSNSLIDRLKKPEKENSNDSRS